MKLIDSPAEVGIDRDEIAETPGAILDIHEDVLRSLMTTPHPIQVNAQGTGATGGDGPASFHARRRTCV